MKTQEQREDHFDMRILLRLGAWGGGAAAAMAIAIVALRSDIGEQRIASAYTKTQTAQINPDALARLQTSAEDTRRLAEGMRTLSADRDRLLARVTVLERNLEGVTGSISRRAAEPKPEASPSAAPQAKSAAGEVAGPTALSTAITTATVQPTPLPLKRPQAVVVPPRANAPLAAPPPVVAAPATTPADVETTQSIATTSEFGVDIGGGATMDALRDLWGAARNNHGAALQGLRPVIAVRDSEKPGGGVGLRLVAGPLANAGAAAKICASLAAGGWACKAAVFDGQKLTVR